VYWRVGGWYVIGRCSTNGTFMNGSGIKAPARVELVAVRQLGRRVRLRLNAALSGS
jgi:hypothetical protein